MLPSEPRAPLVVVHPGTSAPARAYPEPLWVSAVDRLVQDGWQVALTGNAAEQPLTGRIVDAVGRRRGPSVLDLAGRLDLPRLAAVLDRAEVTVVANTGPAHLVRRGRHSGGLAVRAGGAGAALGTVRRTGRAAR